MKGTRFMTFVPFILVVLHQGNVGKRYPTNERAVPKRPAGTRRHLHDMAHGRSRQRRSTALSSKEPILHVQNVGTLEENAAGLVTKSPALRLNRLLLQRCCGLIQFSAGSVEQDAGTVPVFWRPLHLMVYGCPFVGRHGGHLGKTPLVLHDADSHRWICGVSQQYGTPGGATLHALRGLVVCPSRYLVEEVIKRRIAVRQQLYRVRVPIEDRGPEGDGPRRLAVVEPVASGIVG